MLLIRAIALVRPNLSVYFTLKTFFFFFLFYTTTFSKVLTSVHLFYNPLYLNNNIFLIFNYYFVPIFLSFLLYLSFFLCSYLISQRLRPTFVLLLLLSSSFHGKLLHFLMVKSPPSTSIFFFLFLSWLNHLSTTSTNLHH